MLTHSKNPLMYDLKRKTQSPARSGFALIATLSVMSLLLLVALGTISLSSTSLKVSNLDAARERARANAKMALLQAIGELQANAGPDQRITARANILNEDSKNGQLTGVWNSLNLGDTDPLTPETYSQEYRDNKFRSWLVSTATPERARDITFPNLPPSQLSNPVELWGKGTLGSQATDAQLVYAERISLDQTSSEKGSLAWAVMDEGTKARINTHFSDDASSIGEKTAQLGAGERPRADVISGLDRLQNSYFEEGADEHKKLTSKGITLPNVGYAAESLDAATASTLKELTHDISIISEGLFTNVAKGGLKQDLSLLFNSDTLPSEYRTKSPYTTNLDLGYSSNELLSAPLWDTFHQYSNLYKDHLQSSNGSLKMAQLAPAPELWQSSTQLKENDGSSNIGNEPIYDYTDTTPIEVLKTPPPGLVLTPSIAKVQLVFSLLARDIWKYDPVTGVVPFTEETRHVQGDSDANKAIRVLGWGYQFRRVPPDADFQVDYFMNLMLTPIITLHNPYNVVMECSNLKINFIRTPFAVKFYRDGTALSTDFVPIDIMYGQRQNDNQCNKDGEKRRIFGLNLKDSDDSDTFTLLPGEVKMFSPYLNPSGQFDGDGPTSDVWMQKAKTHDIDCHPGWPGDGLGLSSTRPLGKYMNPDLGERQGVSGAAFGISKDSEVHIEFAPLGVDLESIADTYNIDPKNFNKFTLQMEMDKQVVNTIQIDFEEREGLQKTLLGEGKAARWPASGTVLGSEFHDHYTTPLNELANAQPFAVFNIQGKSTHGAIDDTGDDGRYATKPFAFGHAQSTSSVNKAVSEHSANASHEINLQSIPYQQGTASYLDIDPIHHRTNYLSGQTAQNGTKFGVVYEIPTTPLQAHAQLNNANPGGSSGYMPRFAQPIGNSWAHPMMSSSSAIENSPDGEYKLLDHSFLLNASLYDDFYFSGIADDDTEFGSGNSAQSFLTSFINGQSLLDPRIQLNLPSGKEKEDLNAILNDSDAYKEIPSWQTMQGAFNVNSTSVEAWKAMLASIQGSQAIINSLNKEDGTTAIEQLNQQNQNDILISRFRLPNANTGSSSEQDHYWMGTRKLDQQQLTDLATRIVEEIRMRGPFLSMSDFVNRHLGDDSDPRTQKGALQAAIDASQINQDNTDLAGAGYEISLEQVDGEGRNNYGFKNPLSATGDSNQGATGYISQADLLNVLGNAPTVRSDTFTIRAYGEARDKRGKILATAYCQATIQRSLEWTTGSYAPEETTQALTLRENAQFGRKFKITSFHWLNPSEI